MRKIWDDGFASKVGGGGMGDFKKWGVDTLYGLCFPLVMHVKITGASFLSKKMLQGQ